MSIFACLVFGSNAPLTASVSPPSIYGDRSGRGVAVTGSTTVSVSGGLTPYTYAWSYVSGDATFTCTSPSAATTTFSATVGLGQDKASTWKCRVTDAASVFQDVFVDISVSEISYGSDTR